MAKMTGWKPRSVLSSEYHHCVYAAFLHSLHVHYIYCMGTAFRCAREQQLFRQKQWLARGTAHN